jgi:phenylalanyl-tRNA synthetase beta chain
VTPPSWRFDIAIEEDLIEEVARVLGYDRLPATPPLAPVMARVRAESQRSPHAVRHALASLGYQETINFSFVEERWEHELAGNADPIKVLNPIAAPLAVMRSSLVGSLVQVLRYNLARKATRVRVFEVGRVFKRDASVQAGNSAVQALRNRRAWPAWPMARRPSCSGRSPTRRLTSSTSRAMSRSCSRRVGRAFCAPSTRRCIRAAAPRWSSTVR